MRIFVTPLCCLIGAAAFAGTAHADYTFSGSGPSGTLVSSSETWDFNADGGASATGYLNDWGSPGVGFGVVAYGESKPAYGFDITFSGGGKIDPNSVGIGNSAACAGRTGGGTTFCTISPTDPWEAFLVGSDTIDFRAQNPTFFLSQNQDYFVNVFFDGATPTSFTGAWVTGFAPNPVPSTVPEPSTFALLGTGIAGMWGAARRRFPVQ